MPNTTLIWLIIIGVVVAFMFQMSSSTSSSKKNKSKTSSMDKFENMTDSSQSFVENMNQAGSDSNMELMSENSAEPFESGAEPFEGGAEPFEGGVENFEEFSQNQVTGSYQPTGANVPKAEFVIKSAKQGNNFGGGNFQVKLTGKESQVGPNTTNTSGLPLSETNDYTLGVTPIISKEKKAKKLTAKDLLPKESKDDWFDMPYDKKQMMRIENENLLAGSSTQAKIGIDTQGQTLKNASWDLRAAPPNPKFSVGPWMNSTIEPDYNIKPIM